MLSPLVLMEHRTRLFSHEPALRKKLDMTRGSFAFVTRICMVLAVPVFQLPVSLARCHNLIWDKLSSCFFKLETTSNFYRHSVSRKLYDRDYRFFKTEHYPTYIESTYVIDFLYILLGMSPYVFPRLKRSRILKMGRFSTLLLSFLTRCAILPTTFGGKGPRLRRWLIEQPPSTVS